MIIEDNNCWSNYHKSIIGEVILSNFVQMWIYRAAPFLGLKSLLMRLFIRDLSKLCGVEVYMVEKSNVCMEFGLRTRKNDDTN